MRISITAPNGRGWRIVPIQGGLCYTIQMNPRTKDKKDWNRKIWNDSGFYPSHLPYAIKALYEKICADEDGQAEWVLDRDDFDNLALRIEAYLNCCVIDILSKTEAEQKLEERKPKPVTSKKKSKVVMGT